MWNTYPCQDQALLGISILKEPIVAKDGYIAALNKPGLGVEVDEAAVERFVQ